MHRRFQNTAFIFDNFAIDSVSNEIKLYYKLIIDKKEILLTERYVFPSNLKWKNDSSAALKRAVRLLHVLAGVSYWKAYCSEKVSFASYSLTKEEAVFFRTVYENGLGEFFYKNKIDFRKLISFPYSASRSIPTHPTIITSDRSLLLFGGGKDSLVSAELLKKANKLFRFFHLVSGAESAVMESLLPSSAIVVNREIDPQLFLLNKQPGVFNGHIPISAIVSAAAEIAAILYGFRYVVASNERSANYANVKYFGKDINHQWSKSLEFEEMFQNYTYEYITPSVTFFSLLRPLYEIKILEIFSRYPKYFSKFTSCNANFKVVKKRLAKGQLWCGKCPKCAFVFSMLSAFISKEQLISIFSKNLFADKKLISLFKELLGIRKFKPFECVGIPEEMIYAMSMASESGSYADDIVIRMFDKEFTTRKVNYEKLKRELFNNSRENLISKEFARILPR